MKIWGKIVKALIALFVAAISIAEEMPLENIKRRIKIIRYWLHGIPPFLMVLYKNTN